MFSKTCEYAIRAMIYIAIKSQDGERAGMKDIAKNVGAPNYFIAKILQELSRKNLVNSMKGPNGGFFIYPEGMKRTLGDIVRAVDGDRLFCNCVLGLSDCSERKPCPVHHQYKHLREGIHEMLDNTQIGQFHDEIENKMAFLKRD